MAAFHIHWSILFLVFPAASTRSQVPPDRTLVADYSANRVIELDAMGKETWSMEFAGPWDARALPGGNLLVTEYSANRVLEVTRDKKVVWSFTGLKTPYSAQRLANGNTLVSDGYADRVIEVSPDKRVV